MEQPCVSVFTPVYNGEKYLAECIQSVLAQDYNEFEYTIINNCSTDRSLEIAESYAKKDRRIRVRSQKTFVSAIDNHNTGFSLVPAHSKFCKVVSADDWIMPDCLGKMVRFAEAHPNVGIVGSYQQSGNQVKWKGIPPSVSVVSGRDAARFGLLKGIHILGTPSSVLYRADLLRLRKNFFPHHRSYADTSACYECFRHSDLGFIHEILAAERVHHGQWSTAMDKLDAGSVGYLDVLLQYGPIFLTAAEFETRKAEVFNAYYKGLGGCLLKLRGREFWNFHRSRLKEMGCELPWPRIFGAAIQEVFTEAKHPIVALQKVATVVKSRLARG